MQKQIFLIWGVAIGFLSGCAQISETAKVMWGSSTRALENMRTEAVKKTYQCGLNECYDAILSLGRDKRLQKIDVSDDSQDSHHDGYFDIFINNRKKRHIIVISIEGSVDTTEVGIFFSQPTPTTVTLEVASLSSSAKRKIAEIIFNEMDLRFPMAN